MSLSKTIVTPELAEPGFSPREENTLSKLAVLGHRLDQVARYYNSGTPLGTVEAIDLLLGRLLEAERTHAKILHALKGDGERSA